MTTRSTDRSPRRPADGPDPKPQRLPVFPPDFGRYLFRGLLLGILGIVGLFVFTVVVLGIGELAGAVLDFGDDPGCPTTEPAR